jgi:hypothetical protein
MARATPSIYVQIPAYRDVELGPTLRDLFAKANDLSSLRVAVFWQREPDERLPENLVSHPSLELIEVDWRQSQGCNWARAKLQRGWNGEKYTPPSRLTPSAC